MIKVFEKYTELFRKRYELVLSLNMGEDSIRYDFFLALQQEMNLDSWDIQLEFPLGADSFLPNLTPAINRNRSEKPVMDLVVSTETLKMCAEFGLFRGNSNKEGNINQTTRLFKMLNDFVRLGIYSHLNQCKSYFICVADSYMLNHKLRGGRLPAFPAKSYQFHYEGMIDIMGTSKSAKKAIRERFFHKFRELNLEIVATMVYNTDVSTALNSNETRILIWEVVSERKQIPYGRTT